MDELLNILSRLDYASIIMATVLTSFVLATVNRSATIKKVPDFWLIISIVVLITLTTTDFSELDTIADWQAKAFQLVSTMITSYFLAVNKGQEFANAMLDFTSKAIVAIFNRLKKMLGME
jgi:hypothetical protein